MSKMVQNRQFLGTFFKVNFFEEFTSNVVCVPDPNSKWTHSIRTHFFEFGSGMQSTSNVTQKTCTHLGA